MASKYDQYWENRLNSIKELLEEVFNRGSSRELDVSDLQNYGVRQSWYGVVATWSHLSFSTNF